MVTEENVLILKKYTLIYLAVKGYEVCNLLSNGSVKRILYMLHIIPYYTFMLRSIILDQKQYVYLSFCKGGKQIS